MTRPGPQSREKPLIVLVDDEPGFLDLIAHWLEGDYRLRLFTSGEGVYEFVEQASPDLVILDAHMEPVDGYELCRRIRSNERFDLTSVLFLSGMASDEELLRQVEAGGSGFLTKPIERDELRRVIEEELSS